MPAPGKIHFITNGIFSTSIAGGDIVLFNLAYAAARVGYEINFFGGHAFKQIVPIHRLPGTVTLTDDAPMPKTRGGLSGQIALFRDFYWRYRRTLKLLNTINPEDIVCAASDYWFDVIPVVRSSSRYKVMVLNMVAPTLGQIIARSRPDVDMMRLGSLHHWGSQVWSLGQLAKCPGKHVLYVHPLMETFLDRLNIGRDQRTWISCGIDAASADAVPAQNKLYDVAWIGRIHRQKGIDDLLATLEYLTPRLKDFRALIIGDVKAQLRPEVERRGLAKCVEFSGFVGEPNMKFELLKRSRVFLTPSHYESWGIVPAEALISGLPAVAYDLPCYRPIFGDLIRYAPSFDLVAFGKLAEEAVVTARAGKEQIDQGALAEFKIKMSWLAMQERFLGAMDKMRRSGLTS